MHAEIVIIGDELLSGDIKIIDTNSVYINTVLHGIGIDVLYKTTVGDDEARITEVLRIAAGRVEVVIATGGLGPTVDDVTRQAVAAAAGRGLVFRQDLLDQIMARFERFGVTMSENNRQQAYVPEDAIAIENPVGTAPAFIVESDIDGRPVVFISLPGVPFEMKYLMEHNIVPYLADRFGLTTVLQTRVLRLTGLGESQLDTRIGDLMKLGNPIVGLAAHSGQVDIRIYGRGADAEEAQTHIAEVEATIRERVGEYIFGVDDESLVGVLLARLKAHGLTLATVEAGTGQVLAGVLDIAEAGDIVLASDSHIDVPVLYKQIDEAPADLEELAGVAASAVRRACGASIGLAVLTQPDDAEDALPGGGAVIAVVSEHGARVRRYGYGGHRANAPEWVANHGLGMAWRFVVDGLGNQA
ncbi:MAG: CinA family nicotinamide mononucleotide deamidase-related protein [Anaerolineae bacterium]|nr:CinA family nicotinamide mononucleotide deamidase-related protein [Anaerolineae bacterium]